MRNLEIGKALLMPRLEGTFFLVTTIYAWEIEKQLSKVCGVVATSEKFHGCPRRNNATTLETRLDHIQAVKLRGKYRHNGSASHNYLDLISL